MSPAKPNTRPRGAAIKVWVSPEEAREIDERARSTGLSQSSYLRALGLGHQPRSMFDSDAVLTLAKLNADQGRLGGLLKLCLSEDKRGKGASVQEVHQMLQDIKALQRQLSEAASLVKPASGFRGRR